jgi:hypothetical protein
MHKIAPEIKYAISNCRALNFSSGECQYRHGNHLTGLCFLPVLQVYTFGYQGSGSSASRPYFSPTAGSFSKYCYQIMHKNAPEKKCAISNCRALNFSSGECQYRHGNCLTGLCHTFTPSSSTAGIYC